MLKNNSYIWAHYGSQEAKTAGGCWGNALFVFVVGFFGDVLGVFFFAGVFAPVRPPPFAFGALLVPPAEAPPVSPAPALAAAFFFLEEAVAEDVGTVTWPFGPIFTRNALGWSSAIVKGGAAS